MTCKALYDIYGIQGEIVYGRVVSETFQRFPSALRAEKKATMLSRFFLCLIRFYRSSEIIAQETFLVIFRRFFRTDDHNRLPSQVSRQHNAFGFLYRQAIHRMK